MNGSDLYWESKEHYVAKETDRVFHSIIMGCFNIRPDWSIADIVDVCLEHGAIVDDRALELANKRIEASMISVNLYLEETDDADEEYYRKLSLARASKILADARKVYERLQEELAWHRRRHALVAIRGRM